MSTETSDTEEWSYGDSRVGYDVPKTVRQGGATGPMKKEEMSGNGTAYISHSVNFECTECGDVRRFATSDFMTQYRCDVCGDVRWFEFHWDMNRCTSENDGEGDA